MDLTEAEDIKKRWQEYTEEKKSITNKPAVFIWFSKVYKSLFFIDTLPLLGHSIFAEIY